MAGSLSSTSGRYDVLRFQEYTSSWTDCLHDQIITVFSTLPPLWSVWKLRRRGYAWFIDLAWVSFIMRRRRFRQRTPLLLPAVAWIPLIPNARFYSAIVSSASPPSRPRSLSTSATPVTTIEVVPTRSTVTHTHGTAASLHSVEDQSLGNLVVCATDMISSTPETGTAVLAGHGSLPVEDPHTSSAALSSAIDRMSSFLPFGETTSNPVNNVLSASEDSGDHAVPQSAVAPKETSLAKTGPEAPPTHVGNASTSAGAPAVQDIRSENAGRENTPGKPGTSAEVALRSVSNSLSTPVVLLVSILSVAGIANALAYAAASLQTDDGIQEHA
jgi:hypothetical protein